MVYTKTVETKLESSNSAPTSASWNCTGNLVALSTGVIYDLHKMHLAVDTTITPGFPCFSNQDAYLLATVLDSQLKVWDIRSRNTKVATFDIEAEKVKWSWDDKLLLLMNKNTVTIVQKDKGQVLYSFEGLDAIFMYNSKLLVSTDKGTVKIYDKQRLIHEIQAFASPCTELLLDPQGRYMYTISDCALALQWDLLEFLPTKSFESADLQTLKLDYQGKVAAIVGKSKFELLDGKPQDCLLVEFNPRIDCFIRAIKGKLILCH